MSAFATFFFFLYCVARFYYYFVNLLCESFAQFPSILLKLHMKDDPSCDWLLLSHALPRQCHIHGERTQDAPCTWPSENRICIARHMRVPLFIVCNVMKARVGYEGTQRCREPACHTFGSRSSLRDSLAGPSRRRGTSPDTGACRRCHYVRGQRRR